MSHSSDGATPTVSYRIDQGSMFGPAGEFIAWDGETTLMGIGVNGHDCLIAGIGTASQLTEPVSIRRRTSPTSRRPHAQPWRAAASCR